MNDVVNSTPEDKPPRLDLWRGLEDQFGVTQLIRDYLIPVETNSIWYLLGGVLAISLTLEILTGVLLSLVYAPDAGRAYSITAGLLRTPGWNVILNFHYWNTLSSVNSDIRYRISPFLLDMRLPCRSISYRGVRECDAKPYQENLKSLITANL
jgi:hypothetical protein